MSTGSSTAAGDPASPCLAVCLLDTASGYCRGCFRTIAEIAAWPKLDAPEKRRILALLPARRDSGGDGPRG